MSEPGQYWTIERSKGWTSISRDPNKPFVTVLTDTASCHIHYWTDDAEAVAQGYGVTDLVCHGCGTATRFLFPAALLDQPEAMRARRDEFTGKHSTCVHIGNEMLCPPQYEVAETVDLRETTA